MSHALRQTALGMAGLALFLGMLFLQAALDRQREATPKLQRFMYLPQGEYLRIASLGYEQVVADLLWVQAIQAMGERQVSEEAGQWIYHALDVITTLDPRFVRVYAAGGIALATIVHMIEESNRILEKGIRHNPEVWQLPFYLGFNYYFEYHDDQKAAEYIANAAKLPDAPPFLAPLAAKLYVSARTPQDAIDFLAQVHAQATDDNVRRALEQRLREVVVERDLLLLEEAIGRYRDRYTRAPERLEELVQPGLLRELPKEPFGGRYLYDPQTQSVRSSEMKERLRVYGQRRPK